MMDNANSTKEDPYEGGYADEGPFKTESEEGDAHYVVLKATPKELMITMNYWRYSSYQRRDYGQDAQHEYLILNTDKPSRKYMRIIYLFFYQDQECKHFRDNEKHIY